MPNRKLSITLGLLEQVPETLREPWDQAMTTWWVNLRPRGGLRLTKHGYTILHDVLGIESWQLDLSDVDSKIFTKKVILDLDKKLQWPYFIESNVKKSQRRIIFFSSREAMMATMYGDLESWLKSITANGNS